MQTDVDHNKIIKRIANATLKPNGLFQKGTSRVWIDDNGWYLIIVEFQPSAWSKGTYLNVGIHYLWDEQEYLSFDYGNRVAGFAAFDGNEDKFTEDVERLSKMAMDRVVEYRKFRDLEHARTSILQRKSHHVVKMLYSQMMICGLCKDQSTAGYCRLLMDALAATDLEWTRKYSLELQDKIVPIIHDPERFYRYICDKIESQRNFWRSKSSMKKLNETFTV